MTEGQKILKNRGENVAYELTYLEGDLMKNYLSDLETVQEFDTQYMSLFLFLAFTLKLEHYKWKGEIHIKDHML